jgi:hypothetical protein
MKEFASTSTKICTWQLKRWGMAVDHEGVFETRLTRFDF